MAFKLGGNKELLKQLEKKSKEADKVKEKALVAGAEIIQAAMSRRAPRSSLNKEHMADHIVISKINTKKQTVEVGPEKDFFYGHFVEFGTSKMSAQPFAFPAYEESKDKALEAVAEVIRKEIAR